MAEGVKEEEKEAKEEEEEKMMTEEDLNERVEILIAEALRRKEVKKQAEDEKEFSSKFEGKDFEIPSKIEKKIGKKKYKNYALVIYCRRNREIEVKYLPIQNDLIKIGYLTYDARADCYYTYGRKRIPVMIIPEWSLRPFGTVEYQEAVKDGSVSDAQDITIKAMERMEIEKGKKGLSPAAIVIGIIVVIGIIYAIATGGFGGKP